MAEFPHCNAEVLHAPGECFYCDKFPERQSMRRQKHLDRMGDDPQ